MALFTGLVTWHHGASCGMAPAPLDPPSPPLGHLTHPHPQPSSHPHHPIPFSRALLSPCNSQQQQHDGRRRQKIVSVLWHSVVLLLVGGSTGRWAGLPRRRAAAGVRDPATRHVNTRSTPFLSPSWEIFSYQTRTPDTCFPRSFHIRQGQVE